MPVAGGQSHSSTSRTRLDKGPWFLTASRRRIATSCSSWEICRQRPSSRMLMNCSISSTLAPDSMDAGEPSPSASTSSIARGQGCCHGRLLLAQARARFRLPPWRQRPEAKASLAAAAPASSVSASRSLAAPGRLGKLLGAEHNAVHWRRMAEWARRSVALWRWCRHGDARWGASSLGQVGPSGAGACTMLGGCIGRKPRRSGACPVTRANDGKQLEP